MSALGEPSREFPIHCCSIVSSIEDLLFAGTMLTEFVGMDEPAEEEVEDTAEPIETKKNDLAAEPIETKKNDLGDSKSCDYDTDNNDTDDLEVFDSFGADKVGAMSCHINDRHINFFRDSLSLCI